MPGQSLRISEELLCSGHIMFLSAQHSLLILLLIAYSLHFGELAITIGHYVGGTVYQSTPLFLAEE